jgi:hypothetical protein
VRSSNGGVSSSSGVLVENSSLGSNRAFVGIETGTRLAGTQNRTLGTTRTRGHAPSALFTLPVVFFGARPTVLVQRTTDRLRLVHWVGLDRITLVLEARMGLICADVRVSDAKRGPRRALIVQTRLSNIRNSQRVAFVIYDISGARAANSFVLTTPQGFCVSPTFSGVAIFSSLGFIFVNSGEVGIFVYGIL